MSATQRCDLFIFDFIYEPEMRVNNCETGFSLKILK